MKKILIFIMALVLLGAVAACSQTTANTTTVTPTSTDVTTLAPTTVESTTVEPTTEAPTTALPTTTEAPTTTLASTTTEVTTTEVIYDDRSLVPDSCEHLDNIDSWQPVWCDEFETDGLPDSTKWSYDVGGSGWGNNELQYYTEADLDNAMVSDGNLYITARKEVVGSNQYTSARLVSKYRGDWLYGRIQIRAKMPAGRGLWSALWMLPTDWRYGGWPNSGEIDIMEYVGYDKNEVHGTIHTAAYNHSLGTQKGNSIQVENVESEFQIYEIIWEPTRIQFFVNGLLYFTWGYNPDSNVAVENSDAWPFDQRFHLIMNIAVGGTWGGVMGVDDSVFPQSMVVDYVRVYQKDYAGMDNANPSPVTELTLQEVTNNSIQVKWKHAIDDVMVKQYDIFLNGVLETSTTLNGILLLGLDPEEEYVIDVIAVDFRGNTSDNATLTVNTLPVPNVTDQIEAEFYTEMSGILLEDTEDVGGGKNVGYIENGDWLIYRLRVTEAGNYKVTYRVASEPGNGEIKLIYNRFVPLATTAIDATGGWQIWTDVVSEEFYLAEGVYDFKITASAGGFNLNYFTFEKVVVS